MYFIKPQHARSFIAKHYTWNCKTLVAMICLINQRRGKFWLKHDTFKPVFSILACWHILKVILTKKARAILVKNTCENVSIYQDCNDYRITMSYLCVRIWMCHVYFWMIYFRRNTYAWLSNIPESRLVTKQLNNRNTTTSYFVFLSHD